MKYLLLLLLFATPAYADIKLTAPDECVVGELVRLDAIESDSEVLKWEVIPSTPDFEAVGKRAFFSSRVAGDYLIIIAGSEDNKPVLYTHVIRVDGDSPVTHQLDFRIKELLKKVVSHNGREEAIKLAQSFRAIAGAGIPVENIVESTARANRSALGNSLEQWKPFLDGLAEYLDTKQLSTPEDYQKTWNQIADSIERYVK